MKKHFVVASNHVSKIPQVCYLGRLRPYDCAWSFVLDYECLICSAWTEKQNCSWLQCVQSICC